MSGRFYTVLLAVATVFSWAAFFSLIFFISPAIAGLTGVSILNISLILALIGTMALARESFIYIRRREWSLGSSRYYFYSFLVSAFFITMLYLSHAGLILPQNVIITLLIFTVIAFSVSRKLN